MSATTSKVDLKNKGAAEPPPNGNTKPVNDFAAQFAGDDLEKFAISRPMFLVNKCKGPIRALWLYIAGPFAPGKKAINNEPWYAYVGKLTRPCEVVSPAGTVVIGEPGDEVMLPIAAQLKNIANVVQDEKFATELELSPGPQPAPREMRIWTGRRGKRIPRGVDYPRLPFGQGIPLALPMGDEVEETAGGTPF